jgi:hypothetical protein
MPDDLPPADVPPSAALIFPFALFVPRRLFASAGQYRMLIPSVTWVVLWVIQALIFYAVFMLPARGVAGGASQVFFGLGITAYFLISGAVPLLTLPYSLMMAYFVARSFRKREIACTVTGLFNVMIFAAMPIVAINMIGFIPNIPAFDVLKSIAGIWSAILLVFGMSWYLNVSLGSVILPLFIGSLIAFLLVLPFMIIALFAAMFLGLFTVVSTFKPVSATLKNIPPPYASVLWRSKPVGDFSGGSPASRGSSPSRW